jgi:hypothetical protein
LQGFWGMLEAALLPATFRAAAQKQKREDADCAVYASPAGWGALPPLSAGLPECGQEGAQFRLRNRVNK